jgi:hypothetical protein
LASVPAKGENGETVTLLDELLQPRVGEGRVGAAEGTAPQ